MPLKNTLFKRYKSSAINTILEFQEIPTSRGLPFIGTTLSLITEGSTKKLHKYIDKQHRKLGPIFREKIGPLECLFIAEPEIIREVYQKEGKFPIHIQPAPWIKYNEIYKRLRGLFFMDGPDWWHHRKIMNKSLLKNDTTWIYNCCDTVSDSFIRNLQTTKQEDLKKNLHKWSLDGIVALLIGHDSYKKHYQYLDFHVEKLSRIVHLVFETTDKLSLFPIGIASKLKLPQWNKFVNSMDQALINADELVSSLLNLNPSSDSLLLKLSADVRNIDDVRRIVIDLILAAVDTTAVTFEWLLYIIAKYPSYQENLRNDPNFSKLLLRETLRLYPIAIFLTRILPEDCVLTGFEIPKNTLVCMSMYTSGRNERYFKNPEHFDPFRWDRSRFDYNPEIQKASLPFGFGLRSCIGKKIAEIQLQSTIVKVVDTFLVELCNKNDIDIALTMVARPSEDLRLKFHNR